MLDDFSVINFEVKGKSAKVYGVGDLHIGEEGCQVEAFEEFIENVRKDKSAYIAIIGDMLNNATKSSVSDIYSEVIPPSEQKAVLYRILYPVRDRIICIVPGNHELRSAKDVDIDPLYDVAVMLGIQDRYRRNAAFIKFKVHGNIDETFFIMALHGKSKRKEEWMSLAVDGLDCIFTGHTHDPGLKKPAKLLFSGNGDRIVVRKFVSVVVPSWVELNGYALRGMFLPKAICDPPYVEFKATSHNVGKQMKLVWE